MHAITVTALLPWTSFAAPRSAPRCRQLATLRTTRPLCGLREAGDEAHSSKKRHMALMFGFRGTGFYGLQSQSAEGTPGQPTVSDALRRALLDAGAVLPSNFSPLTRTKWTLASRTDKGVHAARAAVSLKMETLDSQLEPLLSPRLDTSGTLPGQFEPLLSLLEPAERAAGPPSQPRLALTAAAVAEINSHLPPEVRLFGGCTVRKSFHCRKCASSRSYEYLLPASALGGMGVAEFDAVLSNFEGSHKARRFFCPSS